MLDEDQFRLGMGVTIPDSKIRLPRNDWNRVVSFSVRKLTLTLIQLTTLFQFFLGNLILEPSS